jgi:hypothetical protein
VSYTHTKGNDWILFGDAGGLRLSIPFIYDISVPAQLLMLGKPSMNDVRWRMKALWLESLD